MITKTKSVYYCEFCKKHLLMKHAMANHETYCTMNPKRLCGMCEIIGDEPTDLAPVIAKIEAYKEAHPIPSNEDFGQRVFTIDDKEFTAEIYDDCNCCPACMLAALKQTDTWSEQFNFKTARDAFWEEERESINERENKSFYYAY